MSNFSLYFISFTCKISFGVKFGVKSLKSGKIKTPFLLRFGIGSVDSQSCVPSVLTTFSEEDVFDFFGFGSSTFEDFLLLESLEDSLVLSSVEYFLFLSSFDSFLLFLSSFEDSLDLFESFVLLSSFGLLSD
jgi:hypothetical protein